MLHLGDVPANSTLYIPFHTFNSSGASVTITGLAATDIEIYKNGSVTQRASDNGYTLLDTDGIDFDGITGIHGFSIDLSDNSDAGFYAAGSFYWVVISSITVDSQTVNFVAATFRIVAAEGTAGTPVVDIGRISNDATAADNCEAFFDGTGYAGTNNVIPTVTTTTTATNVTTVNGLAAGVITAASIAADAITDAKVASDVTIASVTGAVGSVTGNVGGNVTGSVGSVAAGGITTGSFAAGAINAAAIATDAIGAAELAADAATEIAAAVIAQTMDTGYTLKQTLQLIAAASAGKLSISGSTVTIRDLADSANRIVATTDSNGQRTAVTHTV